MGDSLAKIQIKNAKQLEKFLANKMANELYFSSNLQDATAEVMQENIIENVYDAYSPQNPSARRGNDDGFSDMNNMEFTSVDVRGGKVEFVFENITEGGDSMKGNEMAETFEKGIRESWVNPNATDSQGRVVSDARPFIQDTIDSMNANKGKLADALKKDLRNLGFKVR